MEIEAATIIGVVPSPYGYAVFVDCESKVFVIYMDKCAGAGVARALDGEKSERPTTHELMRYVLDGFECSVRDALVYHTDDGTFFARLTLSCCGEEGSKIVELDSRPSDAFSIALLAKAPIYVAKSVLQKVEDARETWEKIKGQI